MLTAPFPWYGGKRRIAYSCHKGDFDLPPGWTLETSTFTGIKKAERKNRLDCVMFSPACNPPEQSDLFR